VPNVKASVKDMIEEGDRIAVRLTIAGTHRGPMLGVAATDKPFSVRAHDIHRFGDDGMVLESWHIEDWLSFLFQVGAMKRRCCSLIKSARYTTSYNGKPTGLLVGSLLRLADLSVVRCGHNEKPRLTASGAKLPDTHMRTHRKFSDTPTFHIQ
jgi:hypothetical protein